MTQEILATTSILELLHRGEVNVTFSNEKSLASEGLDPAWEKLVSIPTDVWDALGQPNVVTVRVDGGDVLNVPEPETSRATKAGRAFGALIGAFLMLLATGALAAAGIGLFRLLQYLVSI